MKAYIFLAEGFEEAEAMIPVDILRRADIEIDTVSVTGEKIVTSSHRVPVVADKLFSEITVKADDYLILPGGMPGTTHLMAHEGLNLLIKKHYDAGNEVAAICAAPSVLGKLGILEGKEAIVFPGFEHNLLGATISTKSVVKSDNVITGKGMGVAIPFALKIVETIKGKETADKVKNAIVFEG